MPDFSDVVNKGRPQEQSVKLYTEKSAASDTQDLLMHRVIEKENGSQAKGLKGEKKKKKTKTFSVCIMTVHEFMGTG